MAALEQRRDEAGGTAAVGQAGEVLRPLGHEQHRAADAIGPILVPDVVHVDQVQTDQRPQVTRILEAGMVMRATPAELNAGGIIR